MAGPENDEGHKWKKKKDVARFLNARPGDMLSSPFQCDDCWFWNLRRRRPDRSNPTDTMLLRLIRRANLDVMWSRESSTVISTLRDLLATARIQVDLGILPTGADQGPWPVGDFTGMGIAVAMLRKSLDSGRNGNMYQQFDSIRKLRSASRNTHLNSAIGAMTTQAFMGEKGKIFRLTSDPTYSQLFTKFIYGCEKRMGRDVKQDQALSLEIMLEILKDYEEELMREGSSKARRRELVMSGASLIMGYCGALRGGEILLAEATSMCKFIREGHKTGVLPHVVACLMGRFKGETGERNVILPFASVTASGIKIRWWFEELTKILMSEGRDTGEPGPAFCDRNGYVLSLAYFNTRFHEALETVQMRRSDLIPAWVKIREIYHYYRSLRRGAVLRAKHLNYDQSIIDTNNRWQKTQGSRGKASLPMGQLYLDILLSLNTHTRFSESF